MSTFSHAAMPDPRLWYITRAIYLSPRHGLPRFQISFIRCTLDSFVALEPCSVEMLGSARTLSTVRCPIKREKYIYFKPLTSWILSVITHILIQPIDGSQIHLARAQQVACASITE